METGSGWPGEVVMWDDGVFCSFLNCSIEGMIWSSLYLTYYTQSVTELCNHVSTIQPHGKHNDVCRDDELPMP